MLSYLVLVALTAPHRVLVALRWPWWVREEDDGEGLRREVSRAELERRLLVRS